MIQTHNERNLACIGLILFAMLALAAVIGTSYHIHSYSKKAMVITGKLEEVTSSLNCSIGLYVDGSEYRLYKDNRYSKRSFGVLNNMPLGQLEDVLDSQVGKDVYIECLPSGRNQKIVQLSIEGTDFVNKDVAIHDFAGYESTTRMIWEIAFVIDLVLLFLVLKRIIH